MAEEIENTELVRLAEQHAKMAEDFTAMREMMTQLVRNMAAIQAPPVLPGAAGFMANTQPPGQGQSTVVGDPRYPLGFGPYPATDNAAGPSTVQHGTPFPQHGQHGQPQVPAATFTIPAGQTLQRSNSDPQLRARDRQFDQAQGNVCRQTGSYDQGRHPKSYADIERLGKIEENDFARKLKSLEQTVKNIQGQGGKTNISYKDMCLFPHVPLPEGFVVPKFDPYTRQSDPRIHMKIYLNKMRGIEKDELLMAYFADSLGGPATEWFVQQDVSKWVTFDDMASAFLNHYAYKMEAAPDRSSLKTITKKPSESFREYAYRWREQAAQVSPLIPDDKMVEEFVEVLDETYYQAMASAIVKHFSEAVRIGEMIDRGIKTGKIVSQTALRAQAGALGKKNQDDVAMVGSGSQKWSEKRYNQTYSYQAPQVHPTQHYYTPQNPQYSVPPPQYLIHTAQPYAPISSYPQWRAPAPHPIYLIHQAPHNQIHSPPNLPQRPRGPPGFHPKVEYKKVHQAKKNEFTPIGESYGELFQKLQALDILKSINGGMHPRDRVDDSRQCAYHSGAPGHDTEDCHFLKKDIQALIDNGLIQVEGSNAPDINQNSLSVHDDVYMVGMVCGEDLRAESAMPIVPVGDVSIWANQMLVTVNCVPEIELGVADRVRGGKMKKTNMSLEKPIPNLTRSFISPKEVKSTLMGLEENKEKKKKLPDSGILFGISVVHPCERLNNA